MIKLERDYNAYLQNEETHFKVHKSGYVLGDQKVREYQDRHAERMKKLQEFAKQKGVNLPVLKSAEEIMNHYNLK